MFGGVVDEVQTHDMTVSLTRQPTSRFPLHEHSVPCIFVLISGSYREWVGSREFEHRPFQPAALSVPPKHRDEIGPKGALFLVLQPENAVATGWPRRQAAPALLSGSISLAAARLASEWRRGAATPFLVEELAFEIFALAAGGFSEERRSAPNWLRDCVDRLHSEFDRHFTVGELAEGLGIEPARLSTAFRRRYGRPMGEYLNEIRIGHACQALSRTKASLAELAVETGFHDQSHFTRVFSSIVGCSPARFRRSVTG